MLSRPMREHREILQSIYTAKGLSHADVAKAMGFRSPATVGNKLRGERDWKTGELERMCEVAGITVVHLAEMSDDLVLTKHIESVTVARMTDDMTAAQRERMIQYAKSIVGE